MKAVVIHRHGGPEVLDYVNVSEPEPGVGEVLVRAHAFGVGRPDSMMRRGVYPWSPPLPFNPGNDLAGDVAALGDGVDRLRLGQRVLVSARDLAQRGGCYSEFIAVSADLVHPLSNNVRYEDACALANYHVAAAILRDMVGPRRPKSILIIGAAGGVGSALVQLAKLQEMTVLALVSSAEKAAFAAAMGADHVIYRERDDLRGSVMKLTADVGVDLIVDHAAGPAFLSYLKLLATWGTLISYGALAGAPQGDLFSALRPLVEKSPSVRCFSIHSYDQDPAGRRSILARLIGLLEKGSIRPSIYKSFPLSEVRAAHALLDEGTALGRIVMHP